MILISVCMLFVLAGFSEDTSDKDVAQENPSDSALKEKEEAEVQRGHSLGSSSIIFGERMICTISFHILGELITTSEVIGAQSNFIKALCEVEFNYSPQKKEGPPIDHRSTITKPARNLLWTNFRRPAEWKLGRH